MRGLVLVLAVAVAVRLAVHGDMAAAPDTFAPVIDGEAYLLQALDVAAGNDISDEVYFQSPVYPFVLGTVLRLAGVPGVSGAEALEVVPPATVTAARGWAARLNLLLGLILVVLVWRCGAVLFGPGAGVAAGLLAALYGPFVFYEGHTLKVVLSLLFVPWAVLAAARAGRGLRAAPWAWCGFALALGALVQGHVQPLIPAAVLALVLRPPGGGPRRFGLACAGALVLGALLALLPVLVRNAVVAGKVTVSGAQAGAAFYLCNNADNTVGIHENNPLVRQVPRHESADFRAATEVLAGRPLAPAEVSAFWRDRALDDIRADPARWLRTELNKLAALVSRYEAPDNTGYFLGAEVSRFLALTPSRYGVVLPLALGGMLLAWRRRRPSATGRGALGLATVVYALVVLVFCVTSRYRMPLVPLLMVYAGALLAGVRDLAGRPLRWAVGGAVLLGWLASLAAEGVGPLTSSEIAQHRAVRYRNRALVAQGRGDFVAARRDLERALEAHAGALKVYVDLARLDLREARILAGGGDSVAAAALSERAEQRLLQAMGLAGDSPELLTAVGMLAYEEGRDEVAVEALTRVVSERPHQREPRQYLTLALLNAADGAPSGEARAAWQEQAVIHAERLARDEPDHDDGHGMLALALLARGRTDEAAAAVRRYDETARAREQAGRARRLPDQPTFAPLRQDP